VYDIDVPDSINVATTMAGLRDAVIASPDQVKSLGLKVVEDLRGKFTDPIQAYTWQLENLWPHCNQNMLTGISPSQTVPVEGVTWTTVGKVDKPVTDSSNKGTFTFDLSAQLGSDAVYLRFQDAYPNDGWGPAVQQVTVTADGNTLASFQPTTAAELPYLFDADSSSISTDGWRFADGGSYWVYKFAPPAGTKALSVQILMWNEFLVSATDTAPTEVVVFPNFRDYIVANRAMVSWLQPDIATQADALDKIFAKAKPATPYLGWFPGSVNGEWAGVGLASQHGIEVIAADFFNNATVLSGTRDRIESRRRAVPPAKLENKVYVSFTFMEGDNAQYDQHRLRDVWDNADRGTVPINWTISPLLADLAPAMLSYYQRTASANDLLIAGPSGGGYTYPSLWPADQVDRFTELTGYYMRRTGMDVVYIFNNDSHGQWQPLSDALGASYAKNTGTLGAILTSGSGSEPIAPGGLPVITDFGGGPQPADYQKALQTKIADWDGTKPMFLACSISAWDWSPTEVTQLASLLKDPFQIVRGDTFFSLIAKATA
jgi:hypothetical protein